MITLGIDPSLTGLGWLIHNSRVVGAKRVVARGVIGTPSNRPFVWRNVHQREAIARIIQEHPEIEAVGCESVAFGESFSEGMYGLFVCVNEAIYRAQKDVVYFDPVRVKLLARGDPGIRRGTMDKRDMIDVCRADTGITKWNHNEADAHIIARSAARFWDLYHGRIGRGDLTPAEDKVFFDTHSFKSGPKKGTVSENGVLFKEGKLFYRWSQLSENDLKFSL